MMADLTAEGVQVGYVDLTVAAIPETCGHDIEVPEITLNGEGFLPAGVSSLSLAIHAARMFTPGAVISGCATKNYTREKKRIRLLIYYSY